MRWMRPKLNVPNLFASASQAATARDTLPDDEPETERGPGDSSIKLKQPITETPPPSAIGHSLADLDLFLAARLLRLEVTSAAYEEKMLLVVSRTLRAALAGSGAHADPLPSDAKTFEALLGETLRAVYAWVFGALDALFLGEHVRPIPKRVVRELAEQADAAATHAKFDSSLNGLAELLRDARRACEQMSAAQARTSAPPTA
jgi:hypothetical protein